ncbi:jg26186, partial [Pararge aegeria aegeria]
NVNRLGILNSHIAYTILKHCLFVPKLMYILRASPVWKFPGLTNKIDAILKDSLEKILNLSLDEYSWTQATLPIKHGGIGVRKISSVALPAFLSSVHSISDLCSHILKSNTQKITNVTEAIENWKVKCPNDDIPKEVTKQKLWDSPLVHVTQQSLNQNLTSAKNRARLLALSTKESGHWLHAVPSKNLGTLLDNECFRVSIGLRLGTQLCIEHRCPCGKEVDSFGLHGLSCPKSSGRLFRHGSLNDIIKRALATIDVPALIEPHGISRDDGKRPDGLTLVPWERGRALVWDATCVDTLAPSHIRETMLKAGAAAEKAETNKRNKYSSLIPNYIFVPFAVETLGPWSNSAKKFIQNITPRLIASTGDRRAGSFFAQRIGIAIQRGNAASILATIPRGHDLYNNYF